MQEKKRPRGRPATGRIRNTSFRIFVTEKEKEMIRLKASRKEKSMVDYIIDLVNQDKIK
ncbi:hypothetical protein [Streptococcus massiliensis]|uniref:Uncharacterized protein n=1 Tax=Streptococcus massiliensis TaxID=313439 RepID=A0A380KZA4_9STRE|nr:hypothetical protein [Streptococcus massiliensis]SUN75880.1 Uncharacterised protein [Streptococcus massiliensis]